VSGWGAGGARGGRRAGRDVAPARPCGITVRRVHHPKGRNVAPGRCWGDHPAPDAASGPRRCCTGATLWDHRPPGASSSRNVTFIRPMLSTHGGLHGPARSGCERTFAPSDRTFTARPPCRQRRYRSRLPTSPCHPGTSGILNPP